MDFETFEPVYEAILADLGYDRGGDETARDLLAGLVAASAPIAQIDADGVVAVAGAAPCLEAEADTAAEAGTVFAASVAADRLRGVGVTVDCMVTDLDKTPETAVSLARSGTPVAAHAHGDNLGALRTYGPRLSGGALVPTTQAAPVDGVYNFGGFTDGDRAAFLADAVGAETLVFPGWEFDDDSLGPEKARKLVWAERLLYWLEQRRGERFGVLDGRRGALDTSALPV